MLTRNHITIALLGFVAIATWWMVKTGEDAVISSDINRERKIDYFVRHLDSLTFGLQGEPKRRLLSPELTHFSDDETTELDTPRMYNYRPGLPPWITDSDHGWMSADGELVLLTGEVIINREEAPTSRPMRIVTSNMRVRPNQDYAETDERAVITSWNDRTDSIGMQAWLTEPGRIKFLSQVKMHHVPIED